MKEFHNTDPRKNAEGYPDPTAYEAIQRIEGSVYQNPEKERFFKVIGCVLRILELSGYSLEEKLVLRDKRTGKIWR